MKKLILVIALFSSCTKQVVFKDVIENKPTDYVITVWKLCDDSTELFRYQDLSYSCWCQELYLSCCPSSFTPMIKLGGDTMKKMSYPFGEEFYVCEVYGDTMIRYQGDFISGLWYWNTLKFYN